MSALPPSPDLAYERKRAKALLRECRAGDRDAIARVLAHLPRLAGSLGTLQLAQAQFVIARERGFESWTKLKTHIESALSADDLAAQFLDAVEHGRKGPASRVLKQHPQVAQQSMFTAAAAGDADEVARRLALDPASAQATRGKQAWTPLAYACASPIHSVSARHAAQVLRAATMLLDAGASPAAGSLYFESDDKPVPISAMYHACMSDNVPLVNLLLDRGAPTQDGESIYHAAQFNRRACLEALLAHGADLSSAQAPYGNTPLYFLVGHADDDGGRAAWFQGFLWLLEHGADPNVASYAKQETPLQGVAGGGPKVATARALLEHGADPNLERGDGRTPYAIAVQHGNQAIARLLVEHGARADALGAQDQLLQACYAGDLGQARAVLAAHPELEQVIATHGGMALGHAVMQDNADAIRVMLELGCSLSAQAWEGGTALHVAAWHGKPDLVRMLLALGAPLDVRDTQFGSSALGWASHGSGQHRGRDDVYIAIVDALLDAGAERLPSINRWGEPPENLASPAVAKHLAARGATTPRDGEHA
jgi:ankyrin repeat protein